MPTFTATGTIQLAPKLVDGKISWSDTLATSISIANGTGSGQANGYWSGTLTIPAADDATIDLLDLDFSAFGNAATVPFASIKHLAIVNQSANVSLTVEPGATDGWDQIGETTIGKSGQMVLYSPVAGLAVGSTTKTVTVTNNGAVTTLAGNLTTASKNVTSISSTSGLSAGMTVTGTGVAANTTIASITNGTSLVLSANAATGGTAVSLDFAWPDAVVAIYAVGILD